ncbi:ferredoxin [Streptosporangium sp. CA-135522]|uniref:ferredoxin n=1 Tax=Streptosporangium sp. CA-135522 TaxID=3240072 RepID=UPI003D925EB9
MKIAIDRARCAGLGICESLAPKYFEVDGDGELVLLREDMPEEDLDRLRAAIEGCPTEALRLES